MSVELNKMLWRYEVNRCSESDLLKVIDIEINLLVQMLGESKNKVNVVSAKRPSDFLKNFENAIDEAIRTRNDKDFRTSLREIKIAKYAFKKLHEFLAANQEFEIAKDSFKKLKQLLNSELENALTIRILSALFKDVDQFFQKKEYRQAQFIVRMCQKKISLLLTKESSAEIKKEHLYQKFNRIKKLSDIFAQNELNKSEVKRVIAALRFLLQENYIQLAENLTDDLDTTLTSRTIFWDEYQRQIRQLKKEGKSLQPLHDRLKEIIGICTWDEASSYLLNARLGELLDEIFLTQYEAYTPV